jgi:hypothetical protein
MLRGSILTGYPPMVICRTTSLLKGAISLAITPLQVNYDAIPRYEIVVPGILMVSKATTNRKTRDRRKLENESCEPGSMRGLGASPCDSEFSSPQYVLAWAVVEIFTMHARSFQDSNSCD